MSGSDGNVGTYWKGVDSERSSCDHLWSGSIGGGRMGMLVLLEDFLREGCKRRKSSPQLECATAHISIPVLVPQAAIAMSRTWLSAAFL